MCLPERLKQMPASTYPPAAVGLHVNEKLLTRRSVVRCLPIPKNRLSGEHLCFSAAAYAKEVNKDTTYIISKAKCLKESWGPIAQQFMHSCLDFEGINHD